MSTYALSARWLLPIDGPPIDGGYVAVVDGLIAAVGPRHEAPRPCTDLGEAVLLPGLINAHTHLEFSDLRRPLGLPGSTLPDWIKLVIGQRRRASRDAHLAFQLGVRESLAAGVTAVGNIATGLGGGSGSQDAPRVVQLHEAIGFSAGRVESTYVDVQHRLRACPAPKGVSPHAPYTVHPRLLERLIELAVDEQLPVAMHLAESREELQLLQTGAGPFQELLVERSMWDPAAIPAGSRPMDYLKLLAKAPRALVVHGNYLTADELQFAAAMRSRMSIVFCPRTHAYFDHQPYPLRTMCELGVRVALGTDSRASNPDLSILNEIRFLLGKHPWLAPADAVRMATLNAAAALGLDAHSGSLAAGKRADLLALSLPPGCSDPYYAFTSHPTQPPRVWLGGEEVRSLDSDSHVVKTLPQRP